MSDFKGRRFPTDVILVCVRWYCKYGISYRDLEEMTEERGVVVDHTTLFRAIIGLKNMISQLGEAQSLNFAGPRESEHAQLLKKYGFVPDKLVTDENSRS